MPACAAAAVRVKVAAQEDFWRAVSFGSRSVTPAQLAALLRRHSCVQCLDLSGLTCGLNDAGLLRGVAPSLQRLRALSYAHRDGASQQCPWALLDTLCDLPALTSLRLSGVALMMDAAHTSGLLSHPGLQELRLQACEVIWLEPRCANLAAISLAGSMLFRMPNVTGCPALRRLDLRGVKKLQDSSVREALPQLTGLHALMLGAGLPVTDDTLREVSRR